MDQYSHIKGVFFDMDGTMLNSEPIHMEALESLLKGINIPLKSLKLLELFRGVADTEIYSSLSKLFAHFSQKIELHIFIKRKNELYIKILEDMSDKEIEKIITPGLKSAIRMFQNQGKLIGVVSASEKNVVYSTLEKIGIKELFNTIEPRQDSIPPKPSPAPYEMAMRKLSLLKDETLIFEDSLTGLKSAQKSGAHVIQITAFSQAHSKRKLNNFNLL